MHPDADPRPPTPTPATPSTAVDGAPVSSSSTSIKMTDRESKPMKRPSSGVGTDPPSWTQRLLADPALCCSKVREEADELCRAHEDAEGKVRTASEAADLLYHAMVLMRIEGVDLEDVLAELRGRFGVSGVDEKAARKK